MTEDELLSGIIDALHVGGWLVHHDRRADLAITQGDSGFPDIFATHRHRRASIAIECKSDTGQTTGGQAAWLASLASSGIDSRIVYPDDYDELIEWLIGDRLVRRDARMRRRVVSLEDRRTLDEHLGR